jgi:hypothetical protein
MSEQSEWSPAEADGWVEGEYAPTVGVGETFKSLVHRPRGRDFTEEELASRARAMALFCHMSVLFGLPVFLAPMVTRDDPFVLHHAKAAGAIFCIFYGALILGIALEPWLFAGVVAAYLPGLIAVHKAAGGEQAGALGLGWLGEALFFPVRLKPEHRKLTAERPRALLEE